MKYLLTPCRKLVIDQNSQVGGGLREPHDVRRGHVGSLDPPQADMRATDFRA